MWSRRYNWNIDEMTLNTITPLLYTDPIPMSTTANYWSRYIIIQYTSYLHISYEMEPVILNQWCSLRFPHKTMPLPLVVWRTANVVFMLFVFVCVYWCPEHILLCFCFVYLRLVYPILSVSLHCPFLMAPSIFSNVYM
jgi:hypothetical protein